MTKRGRHPTHARTSDPLALLRIHSVVRRAYKYAATVREAYEVALRWYQEDPGVGPLSIVETSGVCLRRIRDARQAQTALERINNERTGAT